MEKSHLESLGYTFVHLWHKKCFQKLEEFSILSRLS